jgi:predicted secreted Zn-dependent protease
MQAAMRAASCEAIRQVAQAQLESFRQHDRDYDRDTNHGIAQGAHYP